MPLPTRLQEGGTSKIPAFLASSRGEDRSHGVALEDLTARWLALLFIVYGLIAIGFLAINMPPFQNPDEFAHFF
ncbi:MAG: hypothetical protein JOY97_13935, partial [Hyphomicrobiales bacterium]|nr:hypothetical protein [Hyphomicrobiales bacterium]